MNGPTSDTFQTTTMGKRSYSGDPIDMAWKSGPWANEGETVSGSTKDDMYDETTETLPADVDPSDLTDAQLEIIKQYSRTPNASDRKISDLVGCGRPFVGTTLRKYGLKEGGEYDKLTEIQKIAIDAGIENPDMTKRELSGKMGMSDQYVSRTMSRHPATVEQRRKQLADGAEPKWTPDTDNDTEAEPDPDPRDNGTSVDAQVLEGFGEAMNEARRKVIEGRVYDPENEEVRIEWLRAYTDAVAEYRKLAETGRAHD